MTMKEPVAIHIPVVALRCPDCGTPIVVGIYGCLMCPKCEDKYNLNESSKELKT